MKGIITLALFFVAVLLVAGQTLAPTPPLTPGAAPTASASPTAMALAGGQFTGDSITLARDGSGQFHIGARVNGADTRFLVDTGADMLALTVADAERAGILVDPSAYVPILRTASGEGWGAMVRLDHFELGNTELRNVQAVVVRDLGVSLLGQTILSQFGRVELAGDRMVIEQRP